MPVKSKAKVFDSDYKILPGHNDAQRHADAFSWEVPVQMLTKGMQLDLGQNAGPQVGSPYDADAMGEQRTKITWERDTVSKGRP
jgi:hypothetical protein